MKSSTIHKTTKAVAVKASNATKAANTTKTLVTRMSRKCDEGGTEVSFVATKSSEVVAASTKNEENVREIKKSRWNSMLHLSIKRFDDNDPTLTNGAKRNRLHHPYVVIAEKDPSGRSTCKHCGIVIQPKGVTRISLMMECDKGYRNPCTLHESCFWKHRDFGKVDSADEVYIHQSLIDDDPTFRAKFTETFNHMKTVSELI